MQLLPQPGGGYLASGDKYYIGNGNAAAIVSTFGRLPGGEYVFFSVDSQAPAFQLVKNITATQSYVAEFNLLDLPVAERNHLLTGAGLGALRDLALFVLRRETSLLCEL